MKLMEKIRNWKRYMPVRVKSKIFSNYANQD